MARDEALLDLTDVVRQRLAAQQLSDDAAVAADGDGARTDAADVDNSVRTNSTGGDDERVFDVAAMHREAVVVGNEIRQAVVERTKLTCSVGVANRSARACALAAAS